MTRHFHMLGALALLLAGCGTYYDPTDNYIRGVRMYDRGDFVAARQWWEPLALAGDCDAQFRMGLLHVEGRAARQDIHEVMSWWNKAADQGQPWAQLSLGDFYNSDNSGTRLWCKIDCEKDLTISYKWYLLGQKFAGRDNDKKYAALMLEKIRAQLTPEQKQQGEQLATEWKPAPQACKPRML